MLWEECVFCNANKKINKKKIQDKQLASWESTIIVPPCLKIYFFYSLIKALILPCWKDVLSEFSFLPLRLCHPCFSQEKNDPSRWKDLISVPSHDIYFHYYCLKYGSQFRLLRIKHFRIYARWTFLSTSTFCNIFLPIWKELW